jgi:hypothetical protein
MPPVESNRRMSPQLPSVDTTLRRDGVAAALADRLEVRFIPRIRARPLHLAEVVIVEVTS